MTMGWRRFRGALLAVALAAPFGSAAAAAPGERWSAAWSRPQAIDAVGLGEVPGGGRGPRPLLDQTVRVVTRVTAAGGAVRIHLSNRYGATPLATGTTPLEIRAASVGLRTAGADVAATVPLTFGGATGVTIPPGGTVVSDRAPLAVAAGDDVAVSLHVVSSPSPPSQVGALVTSFASPPGSGDRTAEGGSWPSSTTASAAPPRLPPAASRRSGHRSRSGWSTTRSASPA